MINLKKKSTVPNMIYLDLNVNDYLCVKQSAAAAGICGRSTVSEQEVETAPLSMLIRMRSSVSWSNES